MPIIELAAFIGDGMKLVAAFLAIPRGAVTAFFAIPIGALTAFLTNPMPGIPNVAKYCSSSILYASSSSLYASYYSFNANGSGPSGVYYGIYYSVPGALVDLIIGCAFIG